MGSAAMTAYPSVRKRRPGHPSAAHCTRLAGGGGTTAAFTGGCRQAASPAGRAGSAAAISTRAVPWPIVAITANARS
eukprot:4365546-Pyramimonas_sp.AAC.1